MNDVSCRVTADDRAFFLANGYLVLRGVVAPDEMHPIESVLEAFRRSEVRGMGKDFCDMSGALDRRPDEFALINAMLPRVYAPALQGNAFERRTLEIARAILGDDVGLDYDQYLAKKPGAADAVFAWHQDMAYWPKKTPDTRTITFSLALDDADLDNGCLRIVRGSHGKGLRAHRPLAKDLARTGETTGGSREEAHALVLDLEPGDDVVHLPVKRGDATLHSEWIVHGSGGNTSARWRRTYVVAYRSLATIAYERARKFTHSHNDSVNWDTFERVE